MTLRALGAVAILAAWPAQAGGYDPLETFAGFTVEYLEFREGGRVLPVMAYLPAGASQPWPGVLVSQGPGGSREGSSYLGRHWAGRGYLALFLQHPGSDESVWKGVPKWRVMRAMKQAASAANYRQRVDDVRIALDAVERATADPASPLYQRADTGRIGMSGHSFGARTTQAVAGESLGGGSQPYLLERIDAAIAMSPSPPARRPASEAFRHVGIPWLCMTGTEDAAPRAISRTTPADRRTVFAALPESGHFHELVLGGGRHLAFTERPAPNRNPNHHRLILATSSAFWDAYLRADPDARAWLRSQARSLLQPGDSWLLK